MKTLPNISIFILLINVLSTTFILAQRNAVFEEIPAGKHATNEKFLGLAVNQDYTPEELIKDIFVGGDCFKVSNVQLIGDALGIGSFIDGNSAVGFEEGVILSSGLAQSAIGPNDSDSTSGDLSGSGDVDLNQLATGNVTDVAGIEFDFLVPPNIQTISFVYVFASEEYPEYTCADFNDVFGFFISGPGINGAYSGGGKNIALIPSTALTVSINTINVGYSGSNGDPANCSPPNGSLNYSSLYVDNSNGADLQYDGYTTVLTAVANVIPCNKYHIRLVIGDVGDNFFDSAVFLKANGFSSGGAASVNSVVPHTSSNVGHECCSDAYFHFERSSDFDINVPLVVPFQIGGNASSGQDFSPLPSSIIIPAGEKSVKLPVNLICDNVQEGPEFIELELAFPCLCVNPKVTMEILDAEPISCSAPDIILCENTDSLIHVSALGGIPSYQYLWSNGSTDSWTTIASSDSFIVVTVSDVCNNEFSDTAFITSVPNPELIFEKMDVDCPDADNGTILTHTFSGTSPFQYVWGNGSNSSDLNGLPGGDYFLTVTDFHGCVDSQKISVYEPPPLKLNISQQDATCYGYHDGGIKIDTIYGGTPSYELSLNNGKPLDLQGIKGIPSGVYEILLLDKNNCPLDTTIFIDQPEEIIIDLGDDQFPDLGDEIDIKFFSNYPYSEFDSVIWSPSICNGCINTSIVPINNMDIHLKVLDEHGCAGEGVFSIIVNKVRDVYIPNAFSPNQDGINDVFQIFAGPNVKSVKEFRVFSRWGENVFEAYDFKPNDPDYGWTGNFRGEPAPTGVYVWEVLLEYIDDYEYLMKGSVNLIR